MKIQRTIAAIVLACVMALGAARPAFAGLKINLVYINNPAQPQPPLVAGGGQLQEIMQVAAENWERVFNSGNGNWKLTIEFGWARLRDVSLYAQEFMIKETGNPARITHSCVLFQTNPDLVPEVDGYFADPTPRDNFEYSNYTAYTVNMGDGWLNTGRIFSEPTGDAMNRVDLLQIAMHEIGHALGLDYDYSGFKTQVPGTLGLLEITSPRPFAGSLFYINQGPHPSDFPNALMVGNANPGERRLIGAADAILLAQLSSFNRPDLSEPPLDENGRSQGIPTTIVSSSSSCNSESAVTNTGPL